MNRGCLIGGIVLAGIALLVLIFGSFFVGRYNTMVRSQETVNEAWAQVENVYQRRLDLIPNLVETVKGVANFEQETFTAVAEARAKAGQVQIGADTINDPEAFQRFQEAQGQVTSALSRLLVTVERYPELKANQNFRDLQVALEGTENRVAVERNRYNEAAQGYNTARLRFPTVLFANLIGMREKAYFKAAAGSEQAPSVKFDFGASPLPSPAEQR